MPKINGRPPHIPTKEQRLAVAAMKAGDADEESIAKVLRISKSTLRKAYRTELKDGTAFIGARLKGTAVQKALAGDKTMLIFVLKTKFGWRETERHQLIGKDDKPINFDSLDPASLDQVIAALRSAAPASASGGLEAEED